MATDPTKTDRYSVYGLVAIIIVVLIGGVLQLRSDLFTTKREVFDVARQSIIDKITAAGDDPQKVLGEYDEDTEELIRKQQSDSDGDGLSDFDEEFIYNTSAYLTDTDSDGLLDGEEISGNTNPNCPEGQSCSSDRTDGEGGSTAAELAFAEFNPDANALIDAPVEDIESLLPRNSDGSVDVAAVRVLLREQGLSQAEIDKTSDEDIVAIAEQAVLQAQSGANAFVQVQEEARRINALDTNSKRQFLLESGLSSDEVNSLSDDEVDELVTLAVNQALSNVLEGDDILIQAAGIDVEGTKAALSESFEQEEDRQETDNE